MKQSSMVSDFIIAAAYVADLEQIRQKRVRRGSISSWLVVPRELQGNNLRIFVDYFVDPPMYSSLGEGF